jgi:large subunit ribosomal protein L25
MKLVTLNAMKREKTGKETAKKMRKAGYIPAILYGKGAQPLPFGVRYPEFEKVYRRHHGETVIYNLNFENGENLMKQAILKEIQRDPVTDMFIHLDFQVIEEDKPIELKVPLEFVGKPVGIMKGGVLEIHLHDIVVECLPVHIPDKITVDLSKLDVGQSLHVRDIKVPETIKIVSSPGETVATLVAEEEEIQASE